MTRTSTLLTAAALAATAAALLAVPAQAQYRPIDCAHGPDTWRVRNVANWDRLNIRSGPKSSRRIVGSIPHDGSGVHCLGPCRGNWCRISWRGTQGWVNMRYLGE